MESEPVKMEIVEELNPPINQTFQLKTLDVPHYYLRVKLDFGTRDVKTSHLTKDLIKLSIYNSVKKIFGEFGAASVIDLLSFDPESKEVVLRCPASFYVKLRSSLTLADSCEGLNCYFQVLKASPCLIGLACDSRLYEHSSDSISNVVSNKT